MLLTALVWNHVFCSSQPSTAAKKMAPGLANSLYYVKNCVDYRKLVGPQTVPLGIMSLDVKENHLHGESFVTQPVANYFQFVRSA